MLQARAAKHENGWGCISTHPVVATFFESCQNSARAAHCCSGGPVTRHSATIMEKRNGKWRSGRHNGCLLFGAVSGNTKLVSSTKCLTRGGCDEGVHCQDFAFVQISTQWIGQGSHGIVGVRTVFLQCHLKGRPAGITEFLYSFTINEPND